MLRVMLKVFWEPIGSSKQGENCRDITPNITVISKHVHFIYIAN